VKALILSTHLMGSGHLVRAAALARGIKAAGGKALLITGGRPIPHLDLGGLEVLQLPPVASDGLDYKTLLDTKGAPVPAALLEARRAAILAAFDRFRPDAVITELFPFGRRVLAAEFEALLSAARAARPRPAILASVRDIPEPPKAPGRADEAEARLARFYDAVLVHGEDDGAFEAAWPTSPAVRSMLRYAGYLADPSPPAAPDGPGSGEVLVAVGGGVVGRRLLEIATTAATGSSRPWRLLVGGADADEAASTLKAASGASKADSNRRLIVERARPDYRAMLRRAACSVSLCGYNTALDLIQSGVPAVVVPMEDAGEEEQLIRAQRLARRPQIRLLRQADATPEALAAAVEAAIAAGPVQPQTVDGAARAAAIVAAEVAKVRSAQE